MLTGSSTVPLHIIQGDIFPYVCPMYVRSKNKHREEKKSARGQRGRGGGMRKSALPLFFFFSIQR